MKELFTIDLKNYGDDWKRSRRDSARAIIHVGDDKLAMVYSAKLGYYKFPGGGIHEGEDYQRGQCRLGQRQHDAGIDLVFIHAVYPGRLTQRIGYPLVELSHQEHSESRECLQDDDSHMGIRQSQLPHEYELRHHIYLPRYGYGRDIRQEQDIPPLETELGEGICRKA